MATQENRSMISEVSICNQALSWLGANQITSLEDPSTEGQYCRNNYPFLRDAVLEERMWTFATARHTSTVADMDPWGQQYSHSMPLEWLSVFRVYRTVSGSDPAGWIKSDGWRKEGNQILTDESTVYLWGIKRVVDTGKFSQLFVQALAARIAADLAVPLTHNRQLGADYWNLYQQKLSDAAVRDGQQGSNERLQSGTLIDARSRYGG